MSKSQPSYVWSSQSLNKSCKVIDCPELDSHGSFRRDPSGYYVLIKINFDDYRIEVGVCDKKHNIIGIFSGRKPQDIYDAIFQYEKKNKVTFFREKTHTAYLGKELKKAEIALATGNNAYFQE